MQEDELARAAAAVAAARLRRQRLGRIDALTGVEDGYQVQRIANTYLERHLGPRIGHKIGGTTAAMRAYIGVTEPMAGEIFASTVHPDGATVRRRNYVRVGIETEIAVRLARSLPARSEPYGRKEAAEAIGAVMAAIELVDDRYEGFATIGAATLIADNAFDAGSILGPAVRDWRGLDLAALEARTLREGEIVARGLGSELYGHPLDALAWLASRRASLGLGLEEGTFVSLGSITPVQWVEAPGRYRVEVDELGAVEVTVA